MQESGEMYLETILILKNKNEFVRSIDVAKHLGFSKPSVSRGVGILKAEGYIVIDDNGHINLTDKGNQKAKYVYEKHRILTEFLMKITNVKKLPKQMPVKLNMLLVMKYLQELKII